MAEKISQKNHGGLIQGYFENPYISTITILFGLIFSLPELQQNGVISEPIRWIASVIYIALLAAVWIYPIARQNRKLDQVFPNDPNLGNLTMHRSTDRWNGIYKVSTVLIVIGTVSITWLDIVFLSRKFDGPIIAQYIDMTPPYGYIYIGILFVSVILAGNYLVERIKFPPNTG